MRKGIEVSFKRFVLGVLFAGGVAALGGSALANDHEDALNAARLGDTRQLTELVQRGVSVNTSDEQGNTLLLLAAMEGQLATVKALLALSPDLALRNVSGDSPLMMAALKGETEIVEVLLEAGAPVNVDGWTPLIYAAFEGHLEIVERLLARGADVNALAPNQSNALMFAARNGHMTVVQRLLKTDINVDQVNDRGFTAETWAVSNGNTKIADLIIAERKRRAANGGSVVLEIE